MASLSQEAAETRCSELRSELSLIRSDVNEGKDPDLLIRAIRKWMRDCHRLLKQTDDLQITNRVDKMLARATEMLVLEPETAAKHAETGTVMDAVRDTIA